MTTKKQKHHLLQKARATEQLHHKMSVNQERVMQRPDHFVDLFTGDQAKVVHDKRSKITALNQKLIGKALEVEILGNSQHGRADGYSKSKERMQRKYKGMKGEMETNGVTLPMKQRNVDKRKVQKRMDEALSQQMQHRSCLLYTSDAADDMQCVDLGGRRIIKKR